MQLRERDYSLWYAGSRRFEGNGTRLMQMQVNGTRRHVECARGLDANAAFLLVVARVRVARLAGLLVGDDARLADERVAQRTLAVVQVRDHRHVPDVALLVHHAADMVHRNLPLQEQQSALVHNYSLLQRLYMYNTSMCMHGLAPVSVCKF